MSATSDTFSSAYTSALRRYLESGDETFLQRAYELGRSAIVERIGILDIVRLHHEALDLVGSRPMAGRAGLRGTPSEFLAECLSSFEITYRGFRETIAKLEAEITERKRTEAHLRFREAQLAEAQRLAHVGSWEWDFAHNTLHWSDEIYRIYGVPPGESPTFERYIQYQHPADRDRMRAIVEAARNERKPFVVDGRILRPDGSVRIVHKRGEPVFDSTGKLVGLRGISQDITERTRAEEALRESEARYRLIVETAEEGIWTFDPAGRTTFVNSKLAELLGYEPSEMKGMALAVFLDGEPGISAWLLDGKAAGAREQRDVRLRRKDGTDLWALVSTSPVLDADRRTLGHLAMVTDITRRKIAEDRIHESEERFRSIIENASDIITILNSDATVQYESPSLKRVLGYDQEELVGRNIFQYVHPEDVDHLREVFETGVRTPGFSASQVFRFLHRDGSWRVLESIGKNFQQLPGVNGILVNSRDITDKMKLQEQLEASARQRAEDLRNFAISIQGAQEEERQRIARELHDDLCQRLTAIRLHMNVFENDIPGERKAARKRLTSIKRQIDTTITDVRRLSTNLRPVALDLFGLVTALRHLCEEVGKLHHVRVTFETQDGAPGHFGEQAEIALYRIAQEAITNAVKHAKPSGIWVTLTYAGEAADLEVRDNGAGFPADQPHHPATSAGGLGLFTMRERAELLGGTFSLASSPEQGTTIRVTIPGAGPWPQ